MIFIKALRTRRGWNQTELAFHALMTQGEISKIERRVVLPRPRQAKRLGRVLGVPPEVLLMEVLTDGTTEANRG